MASQIFLVNSSLVVPSWVTSVDIDARGGKSGSGATLANGGRVTGTLPVTPGETLEIRFLLGGLGSLGTDSDGGRSADVRRGGSALANQVVVAGGAGGPARYTVSGTTSNIPGGLGGGLVGGNGQTTNPLIPALIGHGGTQTAGGTGGSGTDGGRGTAAGSGTLSFVGPPASTSTSGPSGNGYYGGEGGGRVGGGAGSGGGGSSYTHPSVLAVTHFQGWATGVNPFSAGRVIITWPDASTTAPPYLGAIRLY